MDKVFPPASDAPETPAPGPVPGGPSAAADTTRTPATALLALLEACRGAAGDNTHGEALLLALRPYLRPERRAQVERIAELVRLARAVHAGYQTTSGGETHA
ncbi:MAG: hypothetical protein LBC26_06015 [Oscillospiraceae bacterium]|jgi:hypothetical protein|nr:hypothetical protein [Oscillospiraceae bacterium]